MPRSPRPLAHPPAVWGFFPKKLADSMPSQGRTWLVMACRGGIANTTYALRAFPEAALVSGVKPGRRCG